MQKVKAVKFIPGIAWFFIVLGLMCIPGAALPHIDDWFNKIYFDKWIHFGVFAVLTILIGWPFNKSLIPPAKRTQYFLAIALFASAFGYCTELMQKYWIPDRDYEVLDWAADSFGALIGFYFNKKVFNK